MKRIFLVEIEPILNYPPVLSILNILCRNGYRVVLCVSKFPHELEEMQKKYDFKVIDYGNEFSNYESNSKKIFKLLGMRQFMWDNIDKQYQDGDIIWCCSVVSLKCLGKRLLSKKYVLQIFELIENLYYINTLKIGRIDLPGFCQKAHKVIVCEYNRAYITQAWYKLSELPTVLNNKLYGDYVTKKNSIYTIEDKAIIQKLNKIKDKKIVLYQGIIGKERPLGQFIDAVNELGNDYEMVIMGKGAEEYEKYTSRNLTCIPFIAPPKYLEVTSNAYIGILTYVVDYSSCLSELNPIYCAPNKIFEYSRFGIPMIGNDIPGLRYTISYNKMGECIEDFNKDLIKEAIQKIENDYASYSKSAIEFYKNVDNEKIIKGIID